MAITVNINGVDRSSLILWPSFYFNQKQTSQVDTLSFQMQKFGSRTVAPQILDEITVYVDATKVFGGNIVQINENVAAVDRIIYNVTVKDYTHLMDRRLVIESYTSKPVINIICDILNRYINKGDRIEIATFENTEIWQGGSIDTTNYIVGDRGRKLTSTNAVMDSMYRDIIVDLQPTGFTTSDYIEIDCWVDDITKLATATLKLGDATLTNYFSKNITSLITVNGHNLVRVAKSGFSSTGSPTWPAIARVKIEVTSTASNTVNVTFDNWQEVKTSAFTRDNANSATQVVNYMAFNYEYPSKALQRMAQLFNWEWYVDENKGIHFFAKFDKASPFNLSDTGGKYVYESLKIENSADQLRNSIFVRGGDYLAPEISENLSHQADGNNKVFKLGYKYANYSLLVNSVPTPVGVDNIDTYTDNNASNQLSYGTVNLNVGDVAGNTKQAQQVIVTKSGRRAKILLRVKKVGAPADNFQIQIFTDSGSNTPSATNKSNIATIAGGSLTTSYVEQTITLVESSAGSLFFEQPTTYHVVLSRSGANDASNYYQVDAVVAGNYSGVGNKYNGSAWSDNSTSVYFIEKVNYDVLYSFNEKILTFSTAPAAVDTIVWSADPYFPIIIQYRDFTSIAEFGEYQYRVIDKSIKTKAGAKQRALEEILAYADQVSEASFKTYSDGLRPGQTINIQSTIRGLDEDYIIVSVQARARSGTALEYTVNCVTTKTMGIIYWLQNQIMKDNQEIEIDENELSDKVDSFNSSITFESEYDYVMYDGKAWSNDALTTPNALQWNGGATHIWV